MCGVWFLKHIKMNDIQKNAVGFSSGSRSLYKDYHMRKGHISTIDKLYQLSVEGIYKLARWKQKLR